MGINLIEIFGDSPMTRKPEKRPSLENIVNEIYHDTDEQGPWIAGGMGRQIALGENNFADIDVWFNSQFQFEKVKRHLESVFGYDMYENFSSDNAITFNVGDYKVQLIRRAYYKNIDEVFANFDFTCCQVAVDKDLKIYGPGIGDAQNYRLKLNKFDNQGFLARYAKYVGYGYVMDNEEFIDIIENREINYEFDGSVFGY